jgi:HK97 gp10 family phage protein
MSVELSFDGLDDLQNLCTEMDISDAKARRALNAGGDILLEAASKNTPEKTGKMKESEKKQITRVNGDLACKVYVGEWYSSFQDWGTSQQKHNVGFFERAVEGCADKVVEAMKNEVLK